MRSCAPNGTGPAAGVASTEAEAAFKDGDVFIERSSRSRQLRSRAGDETGIVCIWGERSSIQRRQSFVKAPSAGLTPEVETEDGEAAVTAARASTTQRRHVESCWKRHKFYFMEMTRIQVEHALPIGYAGHIVRNQIPSRRRALGFSQDE